MDPVQLTQRQAEVLALVTAYVAEHGHPPTIREIRDRLGVSSPNAARNHLETLAKKGYLRHAQSRTRGYILTAKSGACPHCGRAMP